MLLEPDFEKLAVRSQQRLVREFAERYASLRERVRRTPMDEARAIAERFGCPLQVAQVAYLLDLEGILSVGEAVDRLTAELQRRARVGQAVPNIPGNIMEFAIGEGKWLEHIFGSFVRDIELKTRELANLEATLDEDPPSVEKAISVLAARNRTAGTVILPVIRTWVKEHPGATSEDVMMVFGTALTKWSPNTLRGKLTEIRDMVRAFFRRLHIMISGAVDSATMDLTLERLQGLVDGLGAPFDSMPLEAMAHFLLHVAPRLSGRGDRTRYVIRGAASTRGNMAEPEMKTPYDFMERDIHLARRRIGNERRKYLDERLARVMRALKYLGHERTDIVRSCIAEAIERFHLDVDDGEHLAEEAAVKVAGVPEEESEETMVAVLRGFIEHYIYGETGNE